MKSSEFPNDEFIQIDPSFYDGAHLILEGTKFFIFTRKNSSIGIERFHKAIQLAWPKWISYFPCSTPPIRIKETDWGLGGGSLGPFTLAVHLRGEYDQASAKYLESVLGWQPQPTGIAYVEKYFSSFDDPIQTYVTDQVIHVLGHIFFLHGIADLKSETDTWFALGLGLVYDRLIWSEISQTASPVFEAFDHIWKTKYAPNSEIDQRLINPNTDKDEKFGLARLQTYDHAKAGAYLSELRLQIGADKFDAYVRSYLGRPIGSSITCADFLSTFSEDDLKIVHEVESKFVVR